MNTHPHHYRAAWLLISALGTALPAPVRAEDAIEKAFRDALYAEEVKGDSEAALKAYQEVGAKFETQRDMAATALYRQGECLRKLGRKEEAAAAYSKVLSLYGDRERVAKLSRENLAAMGLPAPGNAAAPATAPEVVDEDAKEIGRLKNTAENSPDLLTQGELEGAAYNASPVVVSWLLEKLPKPLAAESLSTALAAASSEGHLKICQLLLDAGASPDGQGASRPFWAAVEAKRLEVMKLLLARKANVNARRDMDNGYPSMVIPEGFSEDLQTVLSGAAIRPGKFTLKGAVPVISVIMGSEMPDALDLLLKGGADPNATFELMKPPSSSRDSNGVRTVETVPPYPLTPLAAAILRGNANSVSRLLEAKADPNKSFGYSSGSPLLFAFMILHPGNQEEKAASENRDRIIESLLNAGADWKGQFSNGAGALHVCARLNLTTWLERGIKAGVDVNARDKYGNTALHHAVRASSATAVQMLLAAGAKADPESPANALVSPLTIACSAAKHGDEDLNIVKMLLEAGADPNRGNGGESAPLNAAMTSGTWFSENLWTKAADLLIEHGARPLNSRMFKTEAWSWINPEKPEVPPVLLETFRRAWHAAHWRDNSRLSHAVWLSQSDSLVHYGKPPSFVAVLCDEAPVTRPPTLREFFNVAPVARGLKSYGGFLMPGWWGATVVRVKEGKEERLPINVNDLIQEPAKNDVPLQWGDVVEIPVKLEPSNEPDQARMDAEGRIFAPFPVEVRLQPAKDRVVTNEASGTGNLLQAGTRRGGINGDVAGSVFRLAGMSPMLFDGFFVSRTSPEGTFSFSQDPQNRSVVHGDALLMRSRPAGPKPDEETLLSSIWICQNPEGPYWNIPQQRTLDDKAAPLAGLMVALLGPHPLPSPCFDWEKSTIRWYGPPPGKTKESSKKDAPVPASVWNEKKLLDAWPSLRMEPGMLITLPPAERESFEPSAKLRAALTSALSVDWTVVTERDEEIPCRYEPRFFRGAKKDGTWVWRDFDPSKANVPLLPSVSDLMASQPRSGFASTGAQVFSTLPDGNGAQVTNNQFWVTGQGTKLKVQ